MVHGSLSMVLACLLSFSSFAKEKAKIEVKVEEKEARLDTTSQAQVIVPSEAAGTAQTVTQLLERAAGVQIRQYGGLDDFAAVSIRGSTTDQVLVYVDGILLNTAHGGVLDLSMLPLDQIARIEVYKGGAPGKTTDSTPGGVIYIYTKRKSKETKNVIRNSLGSFFTYRGHAERSQSFESFYYNAAFDHFRSRGDFSYLDDRGTRANTNDDRIISRQNNDFRAYDFSGTVGREKKDALSWKIYENFFTKNEGIPGLGSQTSSTARLDTLRNLVQAELEARRWKADLFFDYLNSQYQDRQGEIGLGTQDTDDITFRFGPKWEGNLPLPPHHLLTGFAAHRAEFFWPTNNRATPAAGPMSQRHMIGLGAEDEMSFIDEKVIVDPSTRLQVFLNDWTENSVTDAQISAKLGIKVSPWRFLNFKSNIYRGFRQPTFAELFGDRGTIVGNANLNPEESFNFDLGVEGIWKELGWIDQVQFSAAYFRHLIDALIQFLQTSQFTVRAQNLNSALIQGGEFTLALRALENLRWTGHYVYQIAKDDSDNSPTAGNFLPGRPRHQFFTETDYQFPLVRPFVQWQVMGNSYLDSQNLLRVTRRSLLAAGLHLGPWKKTTLSFTAKNLFNDRIADIVGYPLPGRSYWGELEISL
ncbi:MAG: TonB-dependent receptor [Deltaproteobacteria bacterium]|nr:TonB-dependent receptor [Deltaproteobacteria bacterium]